MNDEAWVAFRGVGWASITHAFPSAHRQYFRPRQADLEQPTTGFRNHQPMLGRIITSKGTNGSLYIDAFAVR